MRATVTIYVPNGYSDAAEFLRDCQFEPIPSREERQVCEDCGKPAGSNSDKRFECFVHNRRDDPSGDPDCSGGFIANARTPVPSEILTSEIDEKLMRDNLFKCYAAQPGLAFRVSKEHYRYLAEQIVSLRVHIKRALHADK